MKIKELKDNNRFEELHTCIACESSALSDYFKVPFGKLKEKRSLNYEVLGIDKDVLMSLSRCRSCGMIFTNPRLREENASIIYNQSKANKYDNNPAFQAGTSENIVFEQNGKRNALPWIMRAMHIVGHKKGLSLFDYGCGFGHSLSLAKEFGFAAEGVDVDEFRLQYCRERGLSVYDPAEFKEKGTGKTYDVILCQSVFEHINDLRSFVTFLDSISHSGTVFILNGLTPRLISKEKKKDQFVKAHFIEHINYCLPKTVDILLKKIRFNRYSHELIRVNDRFIRMPRWFVSIIRSRRSVFSLLYIKE